MHNYNNNIILINCVITYCSLHGSSARIWLTSSSTMWLSISTLLNWQLHALQDWALVAGIATATVMIASEYIRGNPASIIFIHNSSSYSMDNNMFLFIPNCCCATVLLTLRLISCLFSFINSLSAVCLWANHWLSHRSVTCNDILKVSMHFLSL
jgi:hypothetical protein